MPIFLTTNTKDPALAAKAALELATYYEADVCYYAGETGEQIIVLKSSHLEVAAHNVGKEFEEKLLKEFQNRLQIFGNTTVTALNRYAFIGLKDLPKTNRIANPFRMGLRFNYDASKSKLDPDKFAQELHKKFFPLAIMQLITSDADKRFEIRINDKAFLNKQDARNTYTNLVTIMKELSCDGIELDVISSSSESIEKRDYGINITGNVKICTLHPQTRFHPIYLDDKDQANWIKDMKAANSIKMNFNTLVFKAKELAAPDEQKLAVAERKDEHNPEDVYLTDDEEETILQKETSSVIKKNSLPMPEQLTWSKVKNEQEALIHRVRCIRTTDPRLFVPFQALGEGLEEKGIANSLIASRAPGSDIIKALTLRATLRGKKQGATKSVEGVTNANAVAGDTSAAPNLALDMTTKAATLR